MAGRETELHASPLFAIHRAPSLPLLQPHRSASI